MRSGLNAIMGPTGSGKSRFVYKIKFKVTCFN